LFFFPVILTAQGFSPFEVGVVYAVSLLLAAVIQFPVGAFVDSYGRKRSILMKNDYING
jgi:MFS family permease